MMPFPEDPPVTEPDPVRGCDCGHPPGWCFIWPEVLGIVVFFAVLALVVKLS